MSNSQSGGLKRKRPDDEDEDEDPPSAPNRRQLHFDPRQQLLDLSYSKLDRVRSSSDSSLSRYVLILNTLRSLEQDMMKDGLKVGPSGSYIPTVNQVPFDPTRPPPPDDKWTNTRTNLNSLEDAMTPVSYSSNPYAMDTETRTVSSVIHPDTSNDIFGSVNSGATYSSEYDRYLMDLDGPSSGRATPFVRSDADSGALWNDDSDRLPSLNWSSVLKIVDGGNNTLGISSQHSETTIESSAVSCNFDASSNSSSGCSSDCSISDDAMSSSETSLHTLMPVTTGIPTCMNTVGVCSTSSSSCPKVTSSLGSSNSQSGSSPPNSEDEIFGDIDLALYDYDFTPLSPPNVKMAPVSAEELMRSLSNDQKIDNLVHTNNYYKIDFCGDDREHLTSVRT